MRGKKRVIKVGNVPVKSREQIEGIRESGKINTMVLDFVEEHIKAGISTQEIDDWVRKVTADNGAICAPYHYEGFPKSVCTSVNSVICHGIPSKDEILKEGDIINVDVSTIYKGYFSDASRMFCIGNVSADKKRLVKTAKEAIQVGLMEVKPFAPLGNMGHAIHMYAKSQGYTVVEEIGGHGVGLEFHEDPFVSYVTPKGSEMLLVPGMMFTIEPMINEGSPDFFVDEDNDWTVYTMDDGLSAQIEYMVLITENGAEVLTK